MSAPPTATTNIPSLWIPFSEPQLFEASQMGDITEAHRLTRQRIPTHSIDDLETHVVADRDDGIFVETQLGKDGKYRAHITIADVAGHVQFESSLVKTALERGSSIYRLGSTDSMFPKVLEEKLSLEHQQDRLGFTISIDLDAQFRLQHMEFMPVITCAESMSYTQAAERMDTDPQLQQMTRIATGIRGHYFSLNGDQTHLLDGVGNDLYLLPPNSLRNAAEMVATYMRFANCCTAEFFDESWLPYVFRNSVGGENGARARYDIDNEGHDGLRRYRGASGAYGHFTSPIRRAADLLNLYMAHFAFDALQAAENTLMERLPSIERTTLHPILWEHGAKILRVCSDKFPDLKQQSIYEAETIICDILTNKLGQDSYEAQQTARSVVELLQPRNPPFSREELSQYVEHLNMLAGMPATRALAKTNEDYKKLQNLEKTTLAAMGKKAFTSLLHRAAMLGEMPRPLYNEALERIDKGRHDNARDGFSILVLASYPDIPRWNMLKRAILRRIKHNPVAVSAIIGQSVAYFGKDVLQVGAANLPEKPDVDSSDQERGNVSMAILVLKQKDHASYVAAPFYSVGHDPRAAISHARYAFLEHYAFRELQSIEQISLPNILYAELESEEKSRRILVEKMVSQAGGKLEAHQSISSSGIVFRLDISGGKFGVPIVVEAEEGTTDDAERAAFRRLLRDRRFKRAVSPLLNVGPIMNPQHMLENVAEKRGYSLTFSPALPLEVGGFLAEIILTGEEMTQVFRRKGPNIDRALRSATVAALDALGESVEDKNGVGIDVRSWVTDNKERVGNHGALTSATSRHPPKRPRKRKPDAQARSGLGGA